MEKRRFCRVVAEGPDAAKPKSGTGYFIRADRVLTAAHVVEGAVKIEIYSELEGASPRAAESVWCRGESGADIALLRAECSEPLQGSVTTLARQPLSSSRHWESYGYAKAAKESDPLLWLKGETSSPAEDDAWFDVTVIAPPEEPRGWGGVSGAPIFVDQVLIGVIGKARDGFNGERLRAASVHLALAEKAFRDALGKEPDERQQRLLQEIERNLERFPLAATTLADCQPAQAGGSWGAAYRGSGFRGLAQALCERSPLSAVLHALDKAHETLTEADGPAPARTAGSAERGAAGDALEEILLRIVPLLHERGLVYTLAGGGAEVLTLPVFTKTMAEMTLAALDRRPLRLRPPENEDDLPDSAYSLLEPAPDAIDVLGFGAFGAFVHEAARTLLTAEDRRYLADTARAPERRHEAVVARLRRFFERRANDSKEPQRYYILLLERSLEKDRDFVALLSKELPLLRIVKPTGDDLEGEGELCEPLVRLLFRAHRLRRNRL